MNRRKFLQLSSLATVATPSLWAANTQLNAQQQLITSVDDRLKRVMRIVGYGNFNIISFDAVRNIAQNYSSVGEFPKAELDFIEELFYQDPREFGFYGIRTCNDLTQPIYENDMYKVPHSGHYLFKEYVSLYERLVQDVGDTLVLTSGVRSIPKQLSLFLSRVRRADFNMYEASHSLAPPGYSYHSVGDFDVGKVGFGWGNFTSRFAQTEEFKRLIKLPYIDIRYFEGNGDGVRYEPWHVQVV